MIYVKLKRSYFVGKQAIAWVSFQATVFLWSWLGSHCKANRLETSLSSGKFSVCFHLPPVTKYPGSVRERNCAEIEWEINFLNAPGRTFIEWLRSRLERKVILCPNSWEFFDSFDSRGAGGVLCISIKTSSLCCAAPTFWIFTRPNVTTVDLKCYNSHNTTQGNKQTQYHQGPFMSWIVPVIKIWNLKYCSANKQAWVWGLIEQSCKHLPCSQS